MKVNNELNNLLLTELDELKKEHQNLQEHFDKIFKFSPVLMAMVSLHNGKFLVVNDAWLTTLEYTRMEVIGRSSQELNLFVDDAVRLKIMQSTINNEVVQNQEIRMRTKLGKIRVGLFSGNCIILHNEKFFLSGVIDVTEKKQAEVRMTHLASIVEGSEDAIIGLTPDFTIQSWNFGAKKMYGYDEEVVIGKPITILVSPDGTDTGDFDEVRHKIIQNIDVGLFEGIRIGKDGKRVYASIRLSPIRNQDGSFMGLASIHRDITDKKTLENELFKSQKLESIGLLAGGIAHDFNNTLAVIMGNIQLAMNMAANGKAIEKHLLETLQATHKAKNLTQQLLTFSKGGAPVRAMVSFSEMLTEIIDFSLHGSNCKCEFDIEDHLWTVEVDEGQIGQVLNNLILNAVQAMPDGGRIAVCARNIILGDKEYTLPLKPGNYLKISIEDEGVGIGKENLDKVFDPFFTTKKNGKGLGLTTSYSIIKRHDGFMEVQSEEGVGTVFHIYIPAITQQINTRQREISTQPDIQHIISAKILFMDDEEAIRQSVGALLAEIGYRVTVVNEGRAAVQLYQQAQEGHDPFDILLMDLTIPGGMGGKETIHQLQKINPEVKAIISSGYSNDPVMANYEDYGFCGVIIKPYKLNELIDLLNKTIPTHP